jgi:hypothetical protein
MKVEPKVLSRSRCETMTGPRRLDRLPDQRTPQQGVRPALDKEQKFHQRKLRRQFALCIGALQHEIIDDGIGLTSHADLKLHVHFRSSKSIGVYVIDQPVVNIILDRKDPIAAPERGTTRFHAPSQLASRHRQPRSG